MAAYLEPIRQTSYLTAGNAEYYRCIMRVFFREYERMHFQLYTEELIELLRTEYPEQFSDYEMEQLKQDLEALVAWKNLTPFQDPKRVYTIADYMKKQYRYAMTEAAVEVERMAVRLENLYLEPANLSTNYFRRIEDALEHMSEMREKELKQVNEWWNGLQEDFRSLNQNYQDYLREFYTGRTDKILKSVEFILHKDRFISYLQEFIREVQKHCDRIAMVLRRISAVDRRVVLERTVESELAVPRPGGEHMGDMEAYFRENIYGRWDALERWFVAKNGFPSECTQVLDITNEIIQKLIQNAALIVQLQNWGISRKSDYEHYIRLFMETEELEDAHRLAAHVFGVQHVRHFKVMQERMTDSINTSTSEEPPAEFLLNPHTRRYRARVDKSGYAGKGMEKAQQRQEYLKRQEQDRRMVMRYTSENRLAVAEIDEVIPEQMRTTLLRWISEANMSSDHTGRTEYGRFYRLIYSDEVCVLHCEDGDLEMPAYILEFEEEEEPA